jgi:hypothetical protein
MTTLENLYYGNIEPCDTETLKRNPRYIESLHLVGEMQQEISSGMSSELKNLFEKYLTESNELSSVIAEDAFKTGFSLAMKIIIEIK